MIHIISSFAANFLEKIKKASVDQQKLLNNFEPGVKFFRIQISNSLQSRFSRDIYFFKGLRSKKRS